MFYILFRLPNNVTLLFLASHFIIGQKRMFYKAVANVLHAKLKKLTPCTFIIFVQQQRQNGNIWPSKVSVQEGNTFSFISLKYALRRRPKSIRKRHGRIFEEATKSIKNKCLYANILYAIMASFILLWYY